VFKKSNLQNANGPVEDRRNEQLKRGVSRTCRFFLSFLPGSDRSCEMNRCGLRIDITDAVSL